jgi:hypothetical protein
MFTGTSRLLLQLELGVQVAALLQSHWPVVLSAMRRLRPGAKSEWGFPQLPAICADSEGAGSHLYNQSIISCPLES